MLSPEREGRYTASAHSVALGLGYESPQAYWRRHKGLDAFSEQAEARMAWGVEHEQDAITAYEALTGEIVFNQQLWTPYEEWSGCTVDGMTDQRIVECKAPQRLYTEPPTQYWVQVQSQMVMTGVGEADLCAWSPDETRIWRTRLDPEYWSRVRDTLQEYWKLLSGDTPPKRGQFKKVKFDIQWETVTPVNG